MDAPHMPTQTGASPLAPVHNRSEGQPFWYVVWPLGMVALILALLVDSCAPRITTTPNSLDTAVAINAINARMGTVLSAVPQDAPVSEVVSLLNLMVIAFEPGNATVPQEILSVLDAAAKAIDRLPSATQITVIGYADPIEDTAIADENDNEVLDSDSRSDDLSINENKDRSATDETIKNESTLATSRAYAVRQALIELGVPPYRLQAVAAQDGATDRPTTDKPKDFSFMTRHIRFMETTSTQQSVKSAT